MPDVGDKLRIFRELTGLSQRALDREAGVPRGTTNDLESGRNVDPSHRTCVLLTRALNRKGLKSLASDDVFPVAPTKRLLTKVAS